MTSGGRIVVVGAGIGGLSAAIALRRAGFEAEVYERAEALRPVGAGLTIQPNAVLALRRLGVGEALEKTGAHLRAGELWRSDGQRLTRLTREDSDALTREAGAPLVGIHRATLHELLVEALGRERLHLGRTCTGYAQDGTRVTARFSDGGDEACDVLVGADGLRSAVRAQVLGDGEPVYAGYTCWRGIAPTLCGVEPGFGGEGWGPTARFGGCTIDGGRFYWFAVADAPQGAKDPPDGAKAFLTELYRDWASPVPELLAATPEEAIFRADICDRPPVERWGEGRVTLLGDAAHAMTPNLGQGACQAIEDALVLGDSLARGGELTACLRAYENLRIPRANAVVTAARRLGAVAHWHNPVAIWLRDHALRWTPSSAIARQLLDAWKLPY
ncbi:MAG: FAD-dependent monooxygenase [Deltaproteobacteria bacterium]|nr:FAD-dependent monooxygenase [Deltaproteobacteria bacterium]